MAIVANIDDAFGIRVVDHLQLNTDWHTDSISVRYADPQPQTIYLKCQLSNDTELLTAEQKGSDTRFWSGCARRTGGIFLSNANITMSTRAFNSQWVHVRTNPNNMLYPFFKDLPAKFSDYIDAKDLGVYSYAGYFWIASGG